jgi:hypothetical protein
MKTATFKKQKIQIQRLNVGHRLYWQREFGSRNADYIANPGNFIMGTYFHQANSFEDKLAIIKFGFDPSFVSRENEGNGLGAGLYVGRDKRVLMNFYSTDFNNPMDNMVVIRGNFRFFDAISKRLPKRNIREFVLSKGYDGIRYYDKDATGEEFILYHYNKIESII